jgi:hypothetical protein
MIASDTFYYPNRMGRIILLSMEEVMGRNGVNAVLKLASLSHLIENYPSDNTELAFPFRTCWKVPMALTADAGLLCELGVPVSIMGFVNMAHNWDLPRWPFGCYRCR